jgi:hypothetical protein
MVAARPLAGLTAAFFSTAPAQAQPVQSLPTQAELEGALLALHVRIATHPEACRRAKGCFKPPKAIKVRDYDCNATGTGPRGEPILYCRVTYVHKGGTLATVKSPNECVPMRAMDVPVVDGPTQRGWEVAMVDHERKCPGARH